MNWKAWLPLAVAIVLGLVAARLAMNVVADRPVAVVPTVQNLTPVVMASGDVPAGTLLAEQHLRVGQVESTSVPAGAFGELHPLVGRVTKIALSGNQPIIPTLLAETNSGFGISATLPEGMRAITVEINDVSGVAGFIQPTCRVDVVATLQVNGNAIARTVLENITVLAVGSRTGPAQPTEAGQPVEPARTLTLLCTPEQAEKLELASSSTRIRLVLRNGDDKSTVGTQGITVAQLSRTSGTKHDPFALPGTIFTSQTPTTLPVAQFPMGTPWTVEIIRAGVQSKQTFGLEATRSESLKSTPPIGPMTDTHDSRY